MVLGANMFIEQMKNLKGYKDIIKGIENNISPMAVKGMSQENLAHIAYAINSHMKKQILILTYDELKAKKIAEDVTAFNKELVEIFPSRQLVFYDIDAFSHDITYQRIKVMDRLAKKENIILVASIESLLNKLMSIDMYKTYMNTIEFGQEIDLEETIKTFVMQGYESVDMIEGKGQFSIRGGIIDFFPVDSQNPFRIELFDNEIDSIRTFDIKTQRSLDNKKIVHISPVKEILIDEGQKEGIIENLMIDLKDTIDNMSAKDNEKITEKLSEKFRSYIEKIDTGLSIENIDMLIPYMSMEFSNILDYLAKDAVVLVDSPNRIEESVDTLQQDFRSKYTDLFEQGEVLRRHEDIYISYDEIIPKIKDNVCITIDSILKANKRFKPKEIINVMVKSMQSFHNKIDLLAEELKNMQYRGYKTILFSGTEERGKRLVEGLFQAGIEPVYIKDTNTEIKSGQIFVTAGTIANGFEYPAIKFAIISDKEIFGSFKRKRSKKARKDTKKITAFTDLKVGDYVVHETHGIGKYVGIEQLDVQGVKKDYFSLKYSGKDMLYIPVDQMDLIQKYIGADTIKPKVSKLGSGEWAKTKNKAKKAIEDMAKELLELYAKRQTVKGYAFSKDQPWQKQFEDLFQYEETEDQLKCIEEIKRDMEKKRPMDRLLCGDVGYGKTEVALRAAFKATLDEKQVAILVPTTILAQQHYNTLVDRFREFPINIEMLSRFRTPGQQKKIIKDLKGGKIDIIVGTHRLLSKDIKFYDLGLLVVDEEQRFGVKHKEKLKALKESIDVLTLTATPIPRTLHMSLIGARDMSIIEEPPEERYPIQTYVLEYNEQLVRDSIIKEMNRDGQVYFVFNRVRGIKKMAASIKALVPEAKIAVAHGQMSERELEKIMLKFMDGEYDVLVCTTIIETGLDISNVNTMIIYDADKMGLSQLYQLRGRVGRSNRIAFAYFMYERDKVLTEVAEKRLKAIKEFTEFGSGFKIAMRDLEIRGAGNLLGSEQHGHMAAIGYDLYVKYLEETVKQLRGEDSVEDIDVSIELNVDGYIPNRYIGNEEHKIEMYKKISAVETNDEYRDVLEELIDRFGDIPKEVNNLLKIARIKSVSKRNGISLIKQIGQYVNMEFSNFNMVTPQLIDELSRRFGRRMSFNLSNPPSLKYKLNITDQKLILSDVEEIIRRIDSFHKEESKI